MNTAIRQNKKHQIPAGRSFEVELWSDIRNDDKEALSKLFCLYYEYLYSYGYKIKPCEEFVKDCIQEIFLTIWNSRQTINQAESVKSYLFSSMRRTIFRKIRQQNARQKRNMNYLNLSADELLNVEELMIRFETQQEHKKKLIEAIQLLGKKQKEAVYLKYYEGLTGNEIADIMGIKRQSVNNHISEGVQKLQRFVQYR